MMIVGAVISCSALIIAADAPPPPALDAVRQALKRHAERLQSRRIKYVRVNRPGPPQKEFPPLDAPDRTETELVFGADGRWRFKAMIVRNGIAQPWRESGCDGERTTTLDGLWTPTAYRRKRVEIGWSRPYPPEAVSLEMGLAPRPRSDSDRRLVALHDSLGLRTSLQWTPDGRVRMIPLVDDRAEYRHMYLLDPAKDYWPVELEWNGPDGKGGRRVISRSVVAEFMPTRPLYPKRMTTWHPGGKEMETGYYTLLAAEFPERFDDAVFKVEIPNGVEVRDETTAKEYIQGGGEVVRPNTRKQSALASAAVPVLTLWHFLQQMTLEDWLVYGGFAVGGVVVALLLLRAFSGRRKGKPESES